MFGVGNRKLLALIDPDRWEDLTKLEELIMFVNEKTLFDGFLVGGSIIVEAGFHRKVEFMKKYAKKNVICFPGSAYQVNELFDGYILPFPFNTYDFSRFFYNVLDVVNLISRKKVMLFSYILLGDHQTSAHFVARSFPLKITGDVARTIANFTKVMKFDGIYMEAGSGSSKTVPLDFVLNLRKFYDGVVVVGGGLNKWNDIENLFEAGADYIVLGNLLERGVEYLKEVLP